MVKGFFLTIFTAAIVLFSYLFFYLGAYKSVELRREKRPVLNLLFKQHLGAYHMLAGTFKEVEGFARQMGLDCSVTFGEYLDDPSSIDQDRLRSNVGCLLPQPPANNAAPLTFETRPERNYVVATFKGSPAIGPMKVYPKVRDYVQEQRLKSTGAVIEIYRVNGSDVTTEYLFPVDQ